MINYGNLSDFVDTNAVINSASYYKSFPIPLSIPKCFIVWQKVGLHKFSVPTMSNSRNFSTLVSPVHHNILTLSRILC